MLRVQFDQLTLRMNRLQEIRFSVVSTMLALAEP